MPSLEGAKCIHALEDKRGGLEQGTLTEVEDLVHYTSSLRYLSSEKEKKYIFGTKSSRSEVVSTRRSTVLIFPFR
jgi:hypothetical protein